MLPLSDSVGLFKDWYVELSSSSSLWALLDSSTFRGASPCKLLSRSREPESTPDEGCMSEDGLLIGCEFNALLASSGDSVLSSVYGMLGMAFA